MGDWTYISGSCESKTVSMKKIIKELLDGEDHVFNYDHVEFDGRFEHGGLQAAKTVQKIIDKAKEFDPNCKIEIEAQINF